MPSNWEVISTTIKPFVKNSIYYYIIMTRVIHLSFHREIYEFLNQNQTCRFSKTKDHKFPVSS